MNRNEMLDSLVKHVSSWELGRVVAFDGSVMNAGACRNGWTLLASLGDGQPFCFFVVDGVEEHITRADWLEARTPVSPRHYVPRDELINVLHDDVSDWSENTIICRDGSNLQIGDNYLGWTLTGDGSDSLIFANGVDLPVIKSDVMVEPVAPIFTVNEGYHTLAEVFKRALGYENDEQPVADLMGEVHLLCVAVDMLAGIRVHPDNTVGMIEQAIAHIADAVVMVSPDLSVTDRKGALQQALDQAQNGKGDERHANSKPFHDQPMQTINDMVGVGFSLGQSIKKIQESMRMSADRQVHELFGALNYAAGAIITIERNEVKDNACKRNQAE